MEYLDGKPMSSIKVGESVSRRMMLTIISEALIGLHHAHELCDFDGNPLDIVHRDVSPHNVFITYDGAVKVLDFGIAKAASVASHTETGEIKGKLTYMAPEQLLGSSLDRRADVFSVGCMIWEAAVGARMWDAVPEARVMHMLATGDIPRPGDRGLIEAELERIILKATAAKPEERYFTALELQQDLSAYLEESGTRHSMREIGATLADSFKEQRDRHKEALARALREPVSLVLEASSVSRADAFTPSRSGGRTLTPATPQSNSLLLPTGSPSLVLEPERNASRWWLPVALLLLGTVAGAVVWRVRPARPQVAPVAAAAVPTVSVRVRVVPPEAAIEIDGKPSGIGTATLNATADAAVHSVRASAPGYMSKTQELGFDRNQELDLRLEKVVVTPVPVPVSSATARASAPVVAPSRRAVPSPRHKGGADENPCSPPYYFVNGIKTYRPECLQ
jgi:serine/threonine-protein kinase